MMTNIGRSTLRLVQQYFLIFISTKKTVTGGGEALLVHKKNALECCQRVVFRSSSLWLESLRVIFPVACGVKW